MTNGAFDPTDQQRVFIEHGGSAFVTACPGAGKTRCIVERARIALSMPNTGQGIAFLSFTKAAVSELGSRLVADGLLPSPMMPHFVGTFDSFIWNFIVQPYGPIGCDGPLRLIPDMDKRIIKPYAAARELPLECFDRDTGAINPAEARKHGFDVNQLNSAAHETTARRTRERQIEAGQLDFEDARFVANAHLMNPRFSDNLARILKARFREIIVDEAQDCNPKDLAIIEWLQMCVGIHTKVVCDPHQSIYGFRGGVTRELLDYKERIPGDNLLITGNFRSTDHICKSVSTLRTPADRGAADDALGDEKDTNIPVYVLSYPGQGVSSKIGETFLQILADNDVAPESCRLVSATRNSGIKAVGGNTKQVGNQLSLQLADAVMSFHASETTSDILRSVETVHRIVLKIEGKLDGKTYHQAIADEELESANWRPEIIDIIKSLKLNRDVDETRNQWVERVRERFAHKLPDEDNTIGRKIQNRAELDDIFAAQPTAEIITRTIHAVKGKEYPGICVVMTTKTANGILTYLDNGAENIYSEEARKLYVGASRAKRLLAIACPRSQADRLVKHLSIFGAKIVILNLEE